MDKESHRDRAMGLSLHFCSTDRWVSMGSSHESTAKKTPPEWVVFSLVMKKDLKTTSGFPEGSEPTAAGGGRKEASEWPRSVCNAAAPSARRTPGTATGEHLCADAEDEAFCCRQYRTHPFEKTFTFNRRCGIMKLRGDSMKTLKALKITSILNSIFCFCGIISLSCFARSNSSSVNLFLHAIIVWKFFIIILDELYVALSFCYSVCVVLLMPVFYIGSQHPMHGL